MLPNQYNQTLERYLSIKNNVELSMKAKLYFNTLQLTLDKNHNHLLQKQSFIDYSFIEPFQNQSPYQKITFLVNMIQYYQSQCKLDHNKPYNISFCYGKDIKTIETTCQMQIFSFGISRWTKIKFKYDKDQKLILLSSKQKEIKIEFEAFLVRRSKKYKNTLVFERIRRVKKQQKISLYFNENLFNEIEGQIINDVFEMRKQDFLVLIDHKDNPYSQSVSQPHLVFLNNENIISFMKFKAQIFKFLKETPLAYTSIFQKQYPNAVISVERSTKINKLFKLSFQIKDELSKFKSWFLNNYKERYCYQRQYSIIQEYSKKYQAISQRYILNNKIYEQISIKEQNIAENNQIYFSKGIDNILCTNFIEFLAIALQSTSTACNLVIIASLKIDKQFTPQVAKQFMVQFYDMTQRDNQIQQKVQCSLQEQFYTVLMNQQDQFQEFMIQIEDEVNQSQTSEIKSLPQQINPGQKGHTFLNTIKTTVDDLSKEELQSKIMKTHYYSGQFQRYKAGGIICINQQSIAQQKQVFKKVVTALGSKIFQIKSGGILNVSLPVQIFKKQSHLQCIASNFKMTPLLLDRFQESKDYLQRLKYIILTTISMNNLGVGSQKPFNPILGETYQCWIGGCPLYLQQVSHHPPGSAYYMVGRGYTINGVISPKISINSLNSGKFWSEKPHRINFEDGSTILFTMPKTLLKGIIYGDRYVNFQGKCYVYDTKNHYFAEIEYGPIKRGFMSSALETEDYLHGRIYRTTSSFLQKFNELQCFPSKEDKAKEICKIQGIWNQEVKFDDKVEINFSTRLPYTLEDEERALASNSLLRKDLSTYIAGDLKLAQEEKEAMQNMQRRDKKLRQKYRKEK